ncbi:MAG TPA: tripartite tricarboxylate transporter substrate-binding protein, partial [Roseomonas sp.]
MRRREFSLTLATAAAISSGVARAQSYPAKPIRIIVPVPPGGGTDIMSRLLQPGLQERLGQPVLVENRPGGGSTIGTHLVAQAPADGYTLLMIDSAIAVNPFLYTRLPFDTERD